MSKKKRRCLTAIVVKKRQTTQKSVKAFANDRGKFFAKVATEDDDDDVVWCEDDDGENGSSSQKKRVWFAMCTECIPILNESEWYFDYALARRGNWVADAQRFKDRVSILEKLLHAPLFEHVNDAICA